MIDDFQKLQHAVAGYLSSLAGMENIAIFIMRPRVLPDGTAVDMPGIQQAVQSSLEGLVSGTDLPGNISITPKAGACLQVLMPRLDVWQHKTNPSQDKIRLTIRVVENLLINNTTDGTNVSAEKFAQLVKDGLHHWRAASGWQLLPDENNTIVPIATEGDAANLVIYEVGVYTFAHGTKITHVAKPVILQSGGLATLSCATPGAAIYYTIDGTFPFARNSRAVLYTAPFSINSGGRLVTEGGGLITTESGDPITTPDGGSATAFITVCAFLDGLAPSDVVEADLT